MRIYYQTFMKYIKSFPKKDWLFLSALLLLMEPLYSPPNAPTGQFTSYITVIITVILGVYYVLTEGLAINREKKIYLLTGILLIFLSFFMFGGSLKEAARYISLLILVFLAGNIKNTPLLLFSKGILIIGFIFTLLNLSEARNTGFLNSSPTLFSLLVLIAITYLYFFSNFKTWDVILIIIGLIMIWLSQSRSTFLFAVMILSSKLLIRWYIGVLKLHPKLKWIIPTVLALLALTIVLLISFDVLSFREGSNWSTMTRIALITTAFKALINEPLAIIFGLGPGEIFQIISNRSGEGTPLHFDLLTIMADFGLIGLAYALLIPKKLFTTWSLIGWCMFLVGSIHNIIYFPIGLVYIILVGKEIKTSHLK